MNHLNCVNVGFRKMEHRTLRRVFNSCVAHSQRGKRRLYVHEDTLPGLGKAVSVEPSLDLLLANPKSNPN